MATATPRDLVAAYDPASESWQWVSLSQYVNRLQPQGWLVGRRKMIADGTTPQGPEPRATDDGVVSADPENVDGEQKAKLRAEAPDMRGVSSGAVETLGVWRINGSGQRATAYLRAKGNGKTLRVSCRTHGAGDRTLTLMLPDVDDPLNSGTPWDVDVIFPESSTMTTHDIVDVPFPDLPSVKTRIRQKPSQNGNVSIESFELV